MTVEDFERHLAQNSFAPAPLRGNDGAEYICLKSIVVAGGRLSGRVCDVAILKTPGVPWTPQTAVHVRPALVNMGEQSSQASAIGPEWQYLSRRFDKVPTPRNFLAYILTVLAELK
jgi:hypothetical protein